MHITKLQCNSPGPFLFSCIFFLSLWCESIRLLQSILVIGDWPPILALHCQALYDIPFELYLFNFDIFFKLEGIYTLAFKLWHYDRLMVEVWNLGVFLKRTFYMVEDNLYMALRASRNGLYSITKWKILYVEFESISMDT